MNRQAIVRFFQLLARHFPAPCEIILTGAGAGALYGRVRPTVDLDFALRLKAGSPGAKERQWNAFGEAARRVSQRTGIALQYAEDIDRWSSITLLDYERHTRPFRKFGKMEVRLLEPAYWAIGKLARYLDPDLRDVIQVFRRQKTSWRRLCPVLGRALRRSPKSTAGFLFRRQVEDFLENYGRETWGRRYPAGEAIYLFHRAARIASPRPKSYSELKSELRKLLGRRR